jgi:hypothetical protein
VVAEEGLLACGNPTQLFSHAHVTRLQALPPLSADDLVHDVAVGPEQLQAKNWHINNPAAIGM